MPTVFVPVIDPLRDYAPALEFGPMVEILPGVKQVFGGTNSTRGFVTEIRDKLAAVTDKDYLLLNGDPVLLAACASVFFERTGILRMLKYDRRIGASGGYHHVVMDLKGGEL